LRTGLHSENIKDVLNSVRLLGNLGATDSIEAIKGLLPTNDPRLEGSVYWSLLKLGDYSQMKQSGEFVEAKSDEFQRMKIADFDEMPIKRLPSRICDCFAAITDEQQLPTLHQFSSSKNDELRYAAAYALREIKSPKSVPVLVSLLDDASQRIRYLAVSTLSRIKNGDSGPMVDEFKRREQEIIPYWKHWWETEGKKKYASH
jgi:HEAT repeat protein